MPSQTIARQLAMKFDKAYPASLSKRLAWWCHELGIDRVHLLRMMGMSTEEAKSAQDVNWADLLKKKEWMENAWWVEGKLHALLALFDYDWNALSDRLHHPLETQRQEPNRVPHQNGDIVKIQYQPDKGGTDVLLSQISRGGPESYPALLSYLAQKHSL